MQQSQHITTYPIKVITQLLIISLIKKLQEEMKNKTVKIENRNGEEPATEEMGKLIEIIEIPNTPFAAVKRDTKWYLSWGQYQLWQPCETRHECEDALQENAWNIIGAYAWAIAMEIQRKHQEEQKQLKRALGAKPQQPE